MEDKKGNIILDKNGKPRRKTPNPRVELLYTSLVCHALSGSHVSIAGVEWGLCSLHPEAQALKVVGWLHGCYSEDCSERHELPPFQMIPGLSRGCFW